MFGYLKSESVRARSTFDVLGIGQRVLTMPGQTISLNSIANVTVGVDPTPRPRVAYAVASVVLAVTTLAAISSPRGLGQGPLGWALLFGAGSLGALAGALLPGDRRHYLTITTTDGRVARFHGQDGEVLEQVRQILTTKLDGAQTDLTCTVNFATGEVAPWTGHASTKLNAPNNRTQDPAREVPTPSRPAPGRLTASATSQAMVPVSARGNGATAQMPVANGAPNGAGDGQGRMPNGGRPIDFYELLPSVVEMQRFYARDPNAAHVEKRLSELELLMRSGAQTPGQRNRISELTGDLTHYLQSYPPAVRVFQDISAQLNRNA